MNRPRLRGGRTEMVSFRIRRTTMQRLRDWLPAGKRARVIEGVLLEILDGPVAAGNVCERQALFERLARVGGARDGKRKRMNKR